MRVYQKRKILIIGVLLLSIVFVCSCSVQADNETTMTCIISINCSTALEHTDILNVDLIDMLPEDGWILEPTEVAFTEGDNVFDVLMRTVRKYNIHMEYMDTPIYDSAYIEGIANLYEFDAGEHSGWMYRVNGKFPNYGCSDYKVVAGDVIEWVYTCDLGNDVGNDNAQRMQ